MYSFEALAVQPALYREESIDAALVAHECEALVEGAGVVVAAGVGEPAAQDGIHGDAAGAKVRPVDVGVE